MFSNPVLTKIGEKYGKTAAQVVLRHALQRDVVVIPKTVRIEKMKENLDVFDFVLSNEDMDEIASLDQNRSSFFSHTDPNMVEWFIRMVEERRKNDDCRKEKKNW